MEKGKKAVWHSPESCEVTDQECVLDKINALAHKDPEWEIIAVSNFNQPHPFDVPTRIAVIERPEKPEKWKYSTHLLSYREDGTIALGAGNYDMSLEGAMIDLKQRAKEEKPHTYRRKKVPLNL